MKIVTQTNLICPVCGFAQELDIPRNYWLINHTCAGCGASLKPMPGDCCVFCSYGEHPCINRQLEAWQEKLDE